MTARVLGSAAAVVLLGAATLDAAGLLPRTRFARERITLTARPRALEVDGLYVYANPLPIPRTLALSVPWGAEPGQAPPAAISAALVDPETGLERALPVVRILGTPRFSVTVPARGESLVRVRFEQRVEGGRATYLLTTTQPWGRPLERGEYVLRVADGVRVVESSYALEGDLTFTRTSFMPDHDWSIAWESP